ncbi:MAG: PKD domain-containing protein, partial [Chloroflexota bacterium]
DGVDSVTTEPQTVVIEQATPALQASFNVEQTDPTALEVGFSASASGGTGSYTYSWSFGDGSTADGLTDPVTSYTYPDPGSYQVVLTVSDGVDSVTTEPQTVVIEQAIEPLSVTFDVSQSVNNPLQFDFTAVPTGGLQPYTYNWAFGDGQTLDDQTEPEASVTYADTGTFTVSVLITDSEGTTATFERIITINQQDVVPVLPDVGSIASELEPVFQAGAAMTPPRNSSAFALIGDQSITGPNYLDPFGNGSYSVDTSASELQSVIDRFANDPAASFSDQTVVDLASELVAPSSDPACNGDSVLVCAINQSNASIVLIGIGQQDAFNLTDPAAFRSSLNTAVQQAIGANAIPVLMMLYPSNDTTVQDTIADLNAQIIAVANNSDGVNGVRVPLINVWRGLNALPNRGLNGNEPSVGPNGAGFLTANPTGGANARNYYTLTVLNDIVNQVFTP